PSARCAGGERWDAAPGVRRPTRTTVETNLGSGPAETCPKPEFHYICSETRPPKEPPMTTAESPRYLELLPAVDVAGGQAVQLVQGVAGSEKHFGDPIQAALRWQEAGAEWLHLVDLDAAFGRGHNRELLAEIVGTLDIKVEMSGGIRDDESLTAALATGCRRVNIGTAALEQPE